MKHGLPLGSRLICPHRGIEPRLTASNAVVRPSHSQGQSLEQKVAKSAKAKQNRTGGFSSRPSGPSVQSSSTPTAGFAPASADLRIQCLLIGHAGKLFAAYYCERHGACPMALALSGLALATGELRSAFSGESPAASALPFTPLGSSFDDTLVSRETATPTRARLDSSERTVAFDTPRPSHVRSLRAAPAIVADKKRCCATRPEQVRAFPRP